MSEPGEVLPTLLALAGVVGVSLCGMTTFVLGKHLQKALPYLVSTACGALLGTAFAHLLPEAIEATGSGLKLSALLVVGFLGSFLLERTLLFVLRSKHGRSKEIACTPEPEYIHAAYEHVHEPNQLLAPNILLSGATHSFIDGLVIATAFSVNTETGAAATIAVLLHEVPHHIADVGVLIYSGLSKTRAVVLNLLATAACVAGGGLFLVLGLRITGLTAILLPLAAANFLYVATAVLLPEMQKEQDARRSLVQMVCLFGGMALMFWLGTLARD